MAAAARDILPDSPAAAAAARVGKQWVSKWARARSPGAAYPPTARAGSPIARPANQPYWPERDPFKRIGDGTVLRRRSHPHAAMPGSLCPTLLTAGKGPVTRQV
jgi:hypothetical protein